MARRTRKQAGTADPAAAAPSVPTPTPGLPLADALRALDSLLAIAIDRQARLLGPATLLDPWRGMHLEQADVERLLAQGNAGFGPGDADLCAALGRSARAVPWLARWARQAALTDSDLALLLVALAPDVDLRYERLYGYLQDDISRKRPSADLMANLLSSSTAERLTLLGRLAGDGALLRSGLMGQAAGGDMPWLARPWRVDERCVAMLLADPDGAGLRTQASADAGAGQGDPLDADTDRLLEQAVALHAQQAEPVRLLLHGPHGAGKFALAQQVARRMCTRLLVLDACAADSEAAARWRAVLAEARLTGALLYLHGLVRLEQRDPQALRSLLADLERAGCSFAISSASVPPQLHAAVLPFLRIALQYPAVAQRRALWRGALQDERLTDEDELRLAARFCLSAAQIRQAAAEALLLSRVQGVNRVGYAELAAAARLQCGTELEKMAQRVSPRADFSVLVAPGEVQSQLREIVARVLTRDTVGRDWAAGSVHARSAGVTALFAGPSGTGKTLSAEALARELGLDMFRIDLAGIVSKYIGETEKNLDRVFAAAENANAVLFFDEADALFGKRSEVKDAHDRYANIEVAYLLQKMEQFDGLAILATNLKQNLDDAFARRLTFTVTFPFPEEPERLRLWQTLWPPGARPSDDVDLGWFAREFRLSGGNIRNAVIAAAHLAASDGSAIRREHLLHATRREYQKLGKNIALPATVPAQPGSASQRQAA